MIPTYCQNVNVNIRNINIQFLGFGHKCMNFGQFIINLNKFSINVIIGKVYIASKELVLYRTYACYT